MDAVRPCFARVQTWDEAATMSQVRRHAVAGLDVAVLRCRRKRATVGALDETGQEKQGS